MRIFPETTKDEVSEKHPQPSVANERYEKSKLSIVNVQPIHRMLYERLCHPLGPYACLWYEVDLPKSVIPDSAQARRAWKMAFHFSLVVRSALMEK